MTAVDDQAEAPHAGSVVVIDDDAAGRELVCRTLRRAGHRVLEASDTVGAWELLPGAEMAIIDVNLPDGNGLDLTRALRADLRFASLAILQTSAVATAPMQQAAGLDSGADAYLVHPVPSQVLTSTVSALLRLRRVEQGLRTLQQLTAALAAAHSFEEVNQQAVLAVARAFPGAASWIREFDHGRQQLKVLVRSWDPTELDSPELIGLDTALPSATVAYTGAPLFLPDRAAALQLFPDWPLPRHGSFGAHAVLPLMTHRGMQGTMGVAYPAARSFTDTDKTLLQSFADVLAVSMERLRVTQHEHAVALRLQEALLPAPDRPATFEIGAAYCPASDGMNIGGDWFDVVGRSDGSVGLIIGDVVGHSLDAAAIMGRIATMSRTLFSILVEPDEVLNRLCQMVGAKPEYLGTTLLLGFFNPAGDTLRFCSAGHLPPLLLAPGRPPTYLSNRPGPPLCDAGTVYQSIHTPLPAGSTLLLYTDGLIERRGESIDTGFARLAESAALYGHLPAQQLVDTLVSQLRQRPQADDIAVLAVRPPS